MLTLTGDLVDALPAEEAHILQVHEALQEMAQIEKAFHLPTWEARTDAPAWMRNLAMVTTLHGMHYTGFIFNDYAKRVGTTRFEEEIKELSIAAEFNLDNMLQLIDWSRRDPYKVERGEGECAI